MANRTPAEAIADLVRAVTKDWAKQRKSEERDRSRERNRRDRLVARHQITLKEAAWSVMAEAYAKASDNGQLPANARQIMYAARPQILELTGKASLDDAYFTQRLLPGYVEQQAAECADWNVVYDARGSFVEPHTGHDIALGTIEVHNYVRACPEGRSAVKRIVRSALFPTIGPENRYGSILFIEKEGFAPLLQRARIAERFDIAITSTKGMTTVSARNLFDELSTRVNKILTLHDFDVSGFTIFGTIAADGRRYRFGNKAIPIADIGLRLADVEALDLQSEPVTISGDWSKRAKTLAQYGANDDEIAFLRDRRVELNAMTSRQLVDLIEVKLAEHGVGKVVPKAAVIEGHARYLIEQRLADEALKKAVPEIAKQAAAVALPPELRQAVEAELKRAPHLPWDTAVSNILERQPRRSMCN